MVTARKLDSGQVQVDAECTDVRGQVQVDAECTDVRGGRKTFPFVFLVSPEDALRLSLDLRDAADPWSEEACIEWLKERCVCGPVWDKGRLRCCTLDGVFYHSDGWPSSLVFLRDRVHVLADVLGIPCPLGDLCKVCHPPVPTDDELAKMGTEELIGWIEGTGHSVLYITTDDPGSRAWSARRYNPHSHPKADTLLGLAQAVAAKLREANEDA